MVLGLNRPLTEMSTRGIYPGGKGGRCLGLTTLQTSCADCLEILKASTSWRPKGLSRPVMIMNEPSLVIKNTSGNYVESYIKQAFLSRTHKPYISVVHNSSSKCLLLLLLLLLLYHCLLYAG